MFTTGGLTIFCAHACFITGTVQWLTAGHCYSTGAKVAAKGLISRYGMYELVFLVTWLGLPWMLMSTSTQGHSMWLISTSFMMGDGTWFTTIAQWCYIEVDEKSSGCRMPDCAESLSLFQFSLLVLLSCFFLHFTTKRYTWWYLHTRMSTYASIAFSVAIVNSFLSIRSSCIFIIKFWLSKCPPSIGNCTDMNVVTKKKMETEHAGGC